MAALVGLMFMLGAADTALAQLGACADPSTGSCTLNQSALTCAAASGVYQGDGTTACRDCDCDGTDDAKDVADCVATCMGLGGTVGSCLPVCSDNGAEDGRPTSCPSLPHTTNGGTKCCDPDSGMKTTIASGFSCTNDVCNADGSVTQTPDHSVCNTLFVDGVCDALVCGPANLGGIGYDAASGCNRINDAPGASCVGNGVGDCTAADTCDGAGTCDDNDVTDGPTALCDDANACTKNECLSGACDNPAEPGGTDCQDGPLSDPCDAPDTCGSGGNAKVCIDRKKANGPEPGCDDSDPCTTDVCTSGACDSSGSAPDGTLCNVGGTMAGLCDAPDSCCSGVCVDIVQSAGTACAGATGDCWDQATCGGGDPGCSFGNINNGPASVACNDNPSPTTKSCGNAALGACDRQDKCDGAGACQDLRRGTGFECRASVDAECDPAENCDGGIDCPADVLAAVGTFCGNPDDAANDGCNDPDTCGDDGTCKNRVAAAGTPCRASSGSEICDPSDSCVGSTTSDSGGPIWDGTLPLCPDAAHTGGVLACESDGNECTNDRCGISGSFTTCFHVTAEKDGDACTTGNGVGVCTDADTCLAGACEDNDLSDSFANVCDDSDSCTLDDHCDGSNGCHGGTAAHSFGTNLVCNDGLSCTVDSCDPGSGCVATLVGSGCGDLLTTFESHASPGPLTDSFEQGCFSIDIMVTDASAAQTGVNCAFTVVTVGSPSCALTVVGVSVNQALFPDFNNSFEEPPNKVFDLGGCTNAGGVGAGTYVRLATIDVISPQDECTAPITVAQSTLTASSLIGQGALPALFDVGAASGSVDIHCFGDLYDHNGDGFVNPADLSMFATAWPPAVFDATFDYDKSGAIDNGDLSFFASAMERFTCAGGIILPCEQTECGCTGPRTNGFQVDDDGNITPVSVKPASNDLVRSLGLPVLDNEVVPVERVRLKKNGKGSARSVR